MKCTPVRLTPVRCTPVRCMPASDTRTPIIIINHIALSCNSYGKLPQLYYSTVLARNKVASGYPSAVIFHACEQASVFSLDSRSKTSDREPYLAHDPLDQRGLWAFRPPEP